MFALSSTARPHTPAQAQPGRVTAGPCSLRSSRPAGARRVVARADAGKEVSQAADKVQAEAGKVADKAKSGVEEAADKVKAGAKEAGDNLKKGAQNVKEGVQSADAKQVLGLGEKAAQAADAQAEGQSSGSSGSPSTPTDTDESQGDALGGVQGFIKNWPPKPITDIGQPEPENDPANFEGEKRVRGPSDAEVAEKREKLEEGNPFSKGREGGTQMGGGGEGSAS